MNRKFNNGDVVRHFKHQWEKEGSTKYLYRIICLATHTETEEPLVVYEALYPPFKICARPLEMFCSEVDFAKYPHSTQKYRFEKID